MAVEELLLFEAQCCDALEYLAMGQRCATDDASCYDSLRPVGVLYWFSLPYRLGIAPEWLIVLHGILLLLSSGLGALALARLAGRRPGWPLAVFSLLVHLAWFFPMWRVALSDMPASLLALIGIWLLLLAQGRRLLVLAAAGALCLGLACLLRTFFLYPLFGAVALWSLVALATRQLRPTLPAIALALLPVFYQYSQVWQASGQWSFLDPHWSAHWSARHLQDNASGYDTVSTSPYRWHVFTCDSPPPDLLTNLRQRDLPATACLVLSRLQFYLGSYSARVFAYGEHDDLLVSPGNPAMTSALGSWQQDNVLKIEEPDPAMATQASDSLARYCLQHGELDLLCRSASNSSGMLVLQTAPGFRTGTLQQIVRVPRVGQPHTASAMVWSPQAVPVTLSLEEPNGTMLASTRLEASSTPALATVTATPGRSGLLVMKLRFASESVTLVIAAPRLEQGQVADWPEQTTLTPAAIRHWSPWLLTTNSLVIAAAGLTVWRRRRQWQAPQWSALAFIALASGLSVVVVPEQRFFVAPLVFCWLLASDLRIRQPALA